MAKKITDKSEEDFLGQIENANQSVSNFIDNYGNTNYLLPNEDWTTPRHLTNEWKDYGNSSHDTSTLNPEYKEGELNEMRAADQGFWEKVGLGATKMTTTAASTFLNNTVGFLWGIGETFKTGNLSTIYDNSFTNLMQDWNDWCEKEMPHYSSKYEGWGADFWGNFIGKDILQNAGFQIGTGASLLVPGAFLKVGGNALKATKMLSNFMKTGRAINTGSAAKDLIIGTYAAIGESTIEALGNKRDFVKFQNQVADDEYAQKQQQLDYEWAQLVQQKYGGNEELARNSMDFNEYFYKGQDLARQRNERKKFIDKEAEKVADMTFLANLALVGGENFVTFGKAFGGYNLNKRFGNIANDIIDSEGKVLKKNVWDSTAEDIIRSGKYKVKNENYGKLIKNEEGKWIRDERKYLEKDAKIQARAKQSSTAFNFAKVAAGEGFEEMNQEVASQYSAGIAEQDMLAYEALAKDGMAYDEILQNLNSTWFSYGELTKALGKVYSDPQQWRQFFGGIIGVGFSPHFTKGADGNLHFHLNNLGAQNADINAKNQTNAYIAEQINNILNSPESQNYLQGMLRHKALDNVKADAVTRNSKMDYEDADFAQFVSDITMMSNAGKLGLLTASLDNMRNMNDDALEETCMQLAAQDKNGDTIGDFVDKNGNFLGNTDDEKLKIREKLNKRIDKLQKDITLYQKAMNDIDGRTGGILDHETLAAYTWEQCNVMNKYARSKDIIGSEDTQKLLGVYSDRIGRSLLNYKNSLKTTEDLLKGEKARIAEQPLGEGEKPKPSSELQKKYESDIENLTKKINQAEELSQLLVDMKNLSVNNSDYKTDKDAIRTLFDKYSDFAKSMPFMAKQIGVLDENGNKKKVKDKNGKESDAGMSLEYLLFSKQFDLFISKYEDSQAAEIDAETKKVLKDLRDSAINYRKAILSEESLENLYEHPEEYVQQRAIFQQKVLEHTNKEAIKEITKEIKNRLNEGSIDAKNLDEKVKEIVEGIRKSKKEKRGFFKSLLNSVENTPYEQLISTAIREVLSDKKYENIKQMRDLIAYMNAAIMGNPIASSSAKRIALETFNKVLQNAKSVDDILKADVKLENFDVTPLYVEETDANKAAKWNAIKQNSNGLPYDRSNYQYTVESVTNAKIVQNEALQLFNNSRELAKQMIWSPKLRSLNETAAKNSAEFETQSKRSQREKIEKNKSTIEEDINKMLDTFGDGKQLNTSEQNELIKKVKKLVNDKFNTENFNDEFKDEVERLRLEYYRKAMDMVDNNLKKRIREYYKQSDDDIETRNQIDKAFGAINKAIGKIQRQLEKNDGNEVFADAFDSIATDDGSIELAHSTEGFYYYNGQVYRGNMIRCNYVNDKYNAVALEQLSDGRYNYLIIDNHGAVLANVVTDDLREPEKRKAEIELTDAEVKSMTPDAFSLQRFANIGVLSEPNVENDKQQKSLQKRRQECCKALIDNGVLDKDGNVNVKSENLLPAIIQSSMIMNPELTEDKTDIKMVVKSTSQPKIERKVEQVKRKRTIKHLDEQITELEQMSENLRESAKENPSYYETLNTVETFKQYVQLVKEIQQNENVANPKNVVLDAKTVDIIVMKLQRQMKEIFGDGVQFMSDKEIEKNLSDNAQLSATLHNNSENLTFNNIDKAIESGEWNKEALDELNNLINDIENGTAVYQRLPEGTIRKGNKASEILGRASIILRGSESTSREEFVSVQRTAGEKYTARIEDAKEQARIIEDWAKASGLWFETYEEATAGFTHNNKLDGSESIGYSDGKGTVRKLLSTEHAISTQKTLDRIALHNKFFPTAPINIIGFTRDKESADGKQIRLVIEQPHIQGRTLKSDEQYKIVEYMKKLGFKPTDETEQRFTNGDKSIYIGDLHPSNVMAAIDENGEEVLFFIDSDIFYRTADLERRRAGNYQIDNSITSTQSESIQFHIGKKARTEFENKLRKARPEMSDAEIKATLDFLHELADEKENNVYVKAAVTWVANRSISLPQDYEKTRQIFDVARKKNIDIQKYKTFGELMSAPEMQKKEKEKKSFDPDKAKSFSNKHTVTTKSGRVFTVYDVEDTEEGQRDVCHALAAHYESSPWCLSTFTKTGEPTESAKRYWKHYNAIPRKIAFENGKPVAFSSDTSKIEETNTHKKFEGYEVYHYSDGSYKIDINQVTKSDKDDLISRGLIEEKDDDFFPESELYLTEKAINIFIKTNYPNTEAWWDMEDTHPQDELSDKIISERVDFVIQLRNGPYPDMPDDIHTNEEAEQWIRNNHPEDIDIIENRQDNRQFFDEVDIRLQEEHELANEDFYELDREEREIIYEEYHQEEIERLNNRTYDDLPFSKSDGEIYGYATNGGIVINKDKFRLDTPVHEYTHLWDNALIEAANKGNEGAKELWKQGIELMKQTSEWEKVVNDPNYANIKSDEDKVASEVHSRLAGMIAAGKMIEIAAKEQKKQTKKGLWARLIDWFKKFKDWTLCNIFNMSADKAKEVTLEQFLNAPVADFFMGTDPRNIGKTDYSQPKQTKQDVAKNESQFVVGDTVTYGTYNDGKYNVVDKKAEVIGITDKGVKIKVGDTIKTVNEQFLSLLYHAKPSSILGNENNVSSIEKKLGEPVSYREALARYIADSDIAISENAAKDVTGVNKDFVSKDGKAFDTIADEFKGAYPQYANVDSQELENTISDLLKNNGSRLELEKYAAQLHFEQQDNDWQAEVNAIENSLNNEEYNNEILNPDELSDEEYAEIFKDEMLDDEAYNEIFREKLSQYQEEEKYVDDLIEYYEYLENEAYDEYLKQRAKELSESNIDDSEGYEDYLNRERLDEEEAQREKLEGYQEPDDNAEMALIAETLAKLRGQIQDDGLDIINDNQALNVLSNVEKNKKEGITLDTFKPAISEYSINDHSISFIDAAQKEGKDYKYIYDMYTSFDAFEYVKQGKLKPNQEVYIAFGHVGQYTVNGQLKRIWKPVFLVKDEKGEYQLIGTLSDSSEGDPDTAEKLSRTISNIYKNEKNRIEYRKIKATKTTDTFKAGEEKGFFLIKQKNGNYLTTKVSKVLNGSLLYSGEKQRSLKDVKIDKTEKTVNQSIDNGEQRPVRIGFYDGGTKLQDNMTADEKAVSEIEGFRSKKSKQKGHVVLIVNKPNGLYQLIPLHVSMFKDLMNNSYNPITKQIDEILKEAWGIYTSNESQKSKDGRLIEKGGIVSRLRNILHMSNMQVFFNLDDNFNQSIRINVNDKKEWAKSSPQNYDEFAAFFKEQLADCFVNINSEILNDNALLNSYIQADVFKTNLESMEFRNAFFTVKPIDSDGNFLDSKKDMPESHDLKESDLSSDFKPFKVYKEGRMEYFVCKDLEGNFGVYSKKIGTKLYKKDNVTTDYRITTQMRMIEYALQKNGIKSGENKDYITTITIEGSDNPIEVLAHPTVVETEYYNPETWEKVTGEVKTDKNKQKEETKQESVQKSEQSSEQKTNISDFANDNFTSKFVEFESGLDYTDGVSKLGQMLDSVNAQDISNYVSGNYNLIDSSSLNKLKMLSKAFGDDMIKSFIDFKKQYNVTQALNDLMEAIDFDDDDIEVDNEKVKEIFEKNKNKDLEKTSNEVDNSCNIFDF